ncbi:MAG: hypothetical protein ACJ719_05695 [Nitrososphaeraceae archaeon]
MQLTTSCKSYDSSNESAQSWNNGTQDIAGEQQISRKGTSMKRIEDLATIDTRKMKHEYLVIAL